MKIDLINEPLSSTTQPYVQDKLVITKLQWLHIYNSLSKLSTKIAKLAVNKSLVECIPAAGATMVYDGEIIQFCNITTLGNFNEYPNQEELTTFVQSKDINKLI